MSRTGRRGDGALAHDGDARRDAVLRRCGRRSCLRALGAAMATGGASMRSLAQQATAATPLTGNWRLTMQLQVVGGQPLAPQRLPGDTTMRFAADGTWRLDESRAWSAGTYRWLDARRIELTTTDASRPTQVGEVALRIVRMEPGTLYLTSRVGGGQAGGGTNAGQAASPAGQNGSEVAVTGVFTRIDDR